MFTESCKEKTTLCTFLISFKTIPILKLYPKKKMITISNNFTKWLFVLCFFRQRGSLKSNLWQIMLRFGSQSPVMPIHPSSKPAQGVLSMCLRRTWCFGPSSPFLWETHNGMRTFHSFYILSIYHNYKHV